MLAAQCVRREYSRSQEGARGAPLMYADASQPVRGVLLIAQSATRRTGRDQLAYVAIDGIRLGKCPSVHFEHWQSAERRASQSEGATRSSSAGIPPIESASLAGSPRPPLMSK